VAQPGAVVNVVVADDGALELLRKVGLLVKDFAAAKQSDTLGAVFASDFLQTPGSNPDGFIPGNKLQLVCFAQIRLRQTFFMTNELVHGEPFDTSIFPVQFGISARGAAFDRSAVFIQGQVKVAANPAVWADNGY
jgi:hypothetical protein